MEAATHEVLRDGGLEVRPAEFVALGNGRPIALTVRELSLLTALARRRGRIVSREELYAVVWDRPFRKEERSVDVYVRKLRAKLEEALPGEAFIHTHFGLAIASTGSLHSFFTRRPHAGNRLPAERWKSRWRDYND